MDRKIISRRIADIQNSLSRLNNNICAMDSLDIQRYPENYETMSTEAALRAEGIACQLRSLLYASTSVQKTEYLVQAGKPTALKSVLKTASWKWQCPACCPKRNHARAACS